MNEENVIAELDGSTWIR